MSKNENKRGPRVKTGNARWTPASHEEQFQSLPRADTANLLMLLPAELRNRIYEFTLTEEGLCHVGSQAWTEPGLLRASKQIRHEALPIYHSNNYFILHLHLDRDHTILGLCRWLLTITSACRSPKPFGAWKIAFSGSAQMSLLPNGITLRAAARRYNLRIPKTTLE